MSARIIRWRLGRSSGRAQWDLYHLRPAWIGENLWFDANILRFIVSPADGTDLARFFWLHAALAGSIVGFALRADRWIAGFRRVGQQAFIQGDAEGGIVEVNGVETDRAAVSARPVIRQAAKAFHFHISHGARWVGQPGSFRLAECRSGVILISGRAFEHQLDGIILVAIADFYGQALRPGGVVAEPSELTGARQTAYQWVAILGEPVGIQSAGPTFDLIDAHA